MARFSRRAAVVTLGAAIVLTSVAACSSSKKSSGSSTSPAASATATAKGGTLYYTTGTRNVEHWDPQRTVHRPRPRQRGQALLPHAVTLGTGAGASSNNLHPDLATTTGTSSDSNKTWTWTLKTGIKWQDGTPVTCEDVKYGVSRRFAADVITGGPNYAIQFLDIPTNADGSSVYTGPYTKKNQADFDKAVDVQRADTITFHLRKSVPDFNYTVSGALRRSRRTRRRRTRARRRTSGVLRRPVHAAGHLGRRQGRHVRAQPELRPEDRRHRPFGARCRTRSSSSRAWRPRRSTPV